MNKEWHLKHPMPKNATLDQRIEWHIAHHEKCNCRDIPESIKRELKKRTTGLVKSANIQ